MDVYRGMDQAALDRSLNNGAAVPAAPRIMADWAERSATARHMPGAQLGLAYGPEPRQRLDWFPALVGPAPTIAFIHGGYWQARTKEDFSFVAAGPVARGFNAALIEYTIAPEARLGRMVEEIGMALDFLERSLDRLGAVPGRICLAGHSAGGHLAACWRQHETVSAVLGISGIYELEPIRLSYLNAKLGLDEDEVARFSPMRQIGMGASLILTVGADELSELVRQTEEYADAARLAGEAVTQLPAPGRNHFDVLDLLAEPDGAALAAVQALFA